jgi:hypothetical protein
MFLPVLLLLLSSQSYARSQTGYVCGGRDAQTEPLRSASGFSAFLTMHSEDDHDKNAHQCQADYTLQIIRPDGTRVAIPAGSGPFGFFSSDADWNRPLVFRVDGYSTDGRRVFVLIAEGGQYPLVEAEEFDMTTGSRLRAEGADRSFLDKLGAACASTLHVSGTTSNGHIVVETYPSNGCSRAELWQLNVHRQIKESLVSTPGTPMRLAPSARILALDPGGPMGRPTD